MRVSPRTLPTIIEGQEKHPQKQNVCGGVQAGLLVGAGLGWVLYEVLVDHPVVSPITAVALPIIGMTFGAWYGYNR